MKKIINFKEAIILSSKLKKSKKKIVLVGGCFDILHLGHIRFLNNSKKLGDFLFVLLESDAVIKKLKGKNRPINTQKERAEILSSLENVDYIIPIKKIFKNSDYDNLIIKLKPDIIATTLGDKNKKHKERQIKKINAKIIYIKKISNRSTSKIINLL